MKKSSLINNIQKRLPDDIIIDDETKFEFTDDEYISILSWIKCFNEHYKIHGKNEGMLVQFPIISKRIRLDFGLYRIPCDLEENKGKYIIYISANGKQNDGTIKKNISVKELVNNWNL